MPTIKNFEELDIWKTARIEVNQLYDDFGKCRDFAFKDQIIRAGISVMNNIAEGFCRNGDAEFRNFLNISKGSADEVKSMIYIAEDQKMISPETATNHRNQLDKLIKSITSFMSYLKSSKT